MDLFQYLQLGLALIIVIGLMAVLSFILKKVNMVQSGMNNKDTRIKIVEQRMIDQKNKLMIVRCDDKDHLVISGQNGNTVIKADMDIPPQKNKKDIPVESL